MKHDYQADEDREDPGRDIEHLFLVTHGIGQKLGMRIDSVNFVHDVNVLRKSLKTIYSTSPELQLLNDEGGDLKRKNSRIQCLPVCSCPQAHFSSYSVKAYIHRLATSGRFSAAISQGKPWRAGLGHSLHLRRGLTISRRHYRRRCPQRAESHLRPRP